MKLSELAADEQKAEAFLQSRGLLQRFTHCPYCASEHLGPAAACGGEAAELLQMLSVPSRMEPPQGVASGALAPAVGQVPAGFEAV